MAEGKNGLCLFIVCLFVFAPLSLSTPVSAEEEIDNWPDGDAWLKIELVSWIGNETVEWDNNNGLPDPYFEICVDADDTEVTCVNTPTWEDTSVLLDEWNTTIDIPDSSTNLTIEILCKDNDAFNDDECDLDSRWDYWKLTRNFPWTEQNSLTVSDNGSLDIDESKKGAFSQWRFTIIGVGDQDGDGVSDVIDLCDGTIPGSHMANQTIFTGCGWEQLDFDTDGLPNGQDPDPYEFFIGDLAPNPVGISEFTSAEWQLIYGGSAEFDPTVSNHHGDMNLVSFNSTPHLFHRDGLFNLETENTVDYTSILCSNLSSPEPCNVMAQDHFRQSFDYNHDGLVDIAAKTSVFLRSEDFFWEDEELVYSYDAKCSNPSNIFWIDMNFDGFIDRICSDSSSILNSHCDRIQSLEYESATRRWVVLCLMTSSSPSTFTTHLKLYNEDAEFIQTIDVENSLFNGVPAQTLIDINGDGLLDLLRGDGHYCLSITDVQNLDSCVSFSWSSGGYLRESYEEAFLLDFDRDGDLDIALQQGILEITESVDGGVIHHSFFEVIESSGLLATAYVDFDIDGDLDLLAYYDDCYPYYNCLKVKLNPGYSDDDNDGILNSEDVCAGYPDSVDWDKDGTPDGCDSDDDNDGTPDVDDLCPETPIGALVDWGCPMDWDEDGVYDGLDQCPESLGYGGVDEEGCDLDSDEDGIPDFDDLCPQTPIGYEVDYMGCTIENHDFDNDGYPDDQDEFPDNNQEWSDSDGDGVGDNTDAFPTNPSKWSIEDGGEVDQKSDSTESNAITGLIWVIFGFGVLGGIVTISLKLTNRKSTSLPRPSARIQQVPVVTQYQVKPQYAVQQPVQLKQPVYVESAESKELKSRVDAQSRQIELLQQQNAQNQITSEQYRQMLEEAEREKQELEMQLEESKNTHIVQNITYNINDSAISGDITNKIGTSEVKED